MLLNKMELIHYATEKEKIPPCFIWMAKEYGGIIDMGRCPSTENISKVTCKKCLELIK